MVKLKSSAAIRNPKISRVIAARGPQRSHLPARFEGDLSIVISTILLKKKSNAGKRRKCREDDCCEIQSKI